MLLIRTISVLPGRHFLFCVCSCCSVIKLMVTTTSARSFQPCSKTVQLSSGQKTPTEPNFAVGRSPRKFAFLQPQTQSFSKTLLVCCLCGRSTRKETVLETISTPTRSHTHALRHTHIHTHFHQDTLPDTLHRFRFSLFIN